MERRDGICWGVYEKLTVEGGDGGRSEPRVCVPKTTKKFSGVKFDFSWSAGLPVQAPGKGRGLEPMVGHLPN